MTPDAMPLNPFPGLRPFKPDESTLFFGRDDQIGEALERLMRQKLLAVVGMSGCGKSSLVIAGMVPALEMGLAGDPQQQWRIEIMRPGDGPLRELERCLGFGGGPLAQRTYALREAVKANLPANESLLLVVDQFEEIFPFRDRMREDGGSEADLFISYLLSAAQEPAARVYIILTMRSDYLGECAKFHGLPEALNDGQYLVPRMTRSQLQEAIEKPLETIAGVDGKAVEFHPGLVQKLLNDCDDEPNNLPLLQHLLRRLFEQWQKKGAQGQITPAMEKEVGQLSGALNQDGETVFEKHLSSEQQRIAELLFRRITESRRQAGGAEDDRPVRRPQTVAHLAELAQAPEAELRAVVHNFEQRGLLVVRSTDELDKVDLPHECLCLKWNRLKTWIEEEARDAKTLRFFSDSAGKSHLTGSALAEAVAWQNTGRLNAAWGERYLSREQLSQVHAWVKESRRLQDARLDERARRMRNRRVTAAIVAILVLGAGGRELYLSRVDAAESRSRELASRARNVWNYDPELAIRLALEAMTVNEENALQVLKESNGNGQQTSGQQTSGEDDPLGTKGIWPSASLPEKSLGGKPFAIALSLDGNRLAVLASVESSQPARASAITLWNVRSQKPSLVTGPVLLDDSTSLAFSPDGRLLAVGSKTSIELRDATPGLPVKQSLKSLPDSETRRVVFSPDGQWLATAQDDDLIRLWDYSHKLAPEVVQAGEVNGFSVVNGGKRIIIIRGATTPPLQAHAIDLKDGRWGAPSPLPFPTCATPQSVSSGAAYFSATWRAHVCTYRSSLAAPEFENSEDDHLVLDIIWSPGGMAYVELLSSMEIAVGTVDLGKRGKEKSIIGARPYSFYSNKSSLMSVDERGTRFALIDKHVNELVRVYTLDKRRPRKELSLPQMDRASMEGFARWLEPRSLTHRECVEYQVKYDLGCQ